jgi:predicted ATP-grasp superfamily ATP-dependent carboligase
MSRSVDIKQTPPALIIGDDISNTLGIARNLGREGVPVYRLGATNNKTLHSRYIQSTFVAPNIDSYPDEEYIAELVRAARHIDCKPVVFPVSDLHVLRLAKNAASLAGHFHLLTSKVETTETLVNKRKFYETLENNGILHPKAYFPGDGLDFESLAETIGYPVLLKPEISPLFYQQFQCKVFVANDKSELRRHLKTLESSKSSMMIQEIVPGGADCLRGCAGFKSGSKTLVFCFRRLREYPSGFGAGSCQESIPSFIGQTRLMEYLDQINYTGIFEAEFKLDPRDGNYKLIEINARSWWQNTHPTISGMNIIKAAYDYAAGQPVQEDDRYRIGTKWIHLYNDYFAARNEGLSLLSWLRSIRGERTFDIWAFDDVRPMLSFVYNMVRRRFLKILGMRQP